MRRLMILWLFSLLFVGVIAAAVGAQVVRPAPPAAQRIMSGADFGFRVEGTDAKGRPIGTMVIRVNGEWVDVGSALRPTPATTH